MFSYSFVFTFYNPAHLRTLIFRCRCSQSQGFGNRMGLWGREWKPFLARRTPKAFVGAFRAASGDAPRIQNPHLITMFENEEVNVFYSVKWSRHIVL